MHLPPKRHARTRLRRRLADNKTAIRLSLDIAPEAVEAREPLWMERHALLTKLENLT